MWSDLTTSQKQKRIYRVTCIRLLFFWHVCGKDRQHYYQQLRITDDNVDTVRDELYNEYISALKNEYYFDYNQKVEKINIMLGKGKYENLHTLDKDN